MAKNTILVMPTICGTYKSRTKYHLDCAIESRKYMNHIFCRLETTLLHLYLFIIVSVYLRMYVFGCVLVLNFRRLYTFFNNIRFEKTLCVRISTMMSEKDYCTKAYMLLIA